MTEEQKSKIMQMLISSDEEMQNLGAIAFAESVGTWENYQAFRDLPDFKKISQPTKKIMRRTMVNSHGRIRKRFKSW